MNINSLQTQNTNQLFNTTGLQNFLQQPFAQLNKFSQLHHQIVSSTHQNVFSHIEHNNVLFITQTNSMVSAMNQKLEDIRRLRRNKQEHYSRLQSQRKTIIQESRAKIKLAEEPKVKGKQIEEPKNKEVKSKGQIKSMKQRSTTSQHLQSTKKLKANPRQTCQQKISSLTKTKTLIPKFEEKCGPTSQTNQKNNLFDKIFERNLDTCNTIIFFNIKFIVGYTLTHQFIDSRIVCCLKCLQVSNELKQDQMVEHLKKCPKGKPEMVTSSRKTVFKNLCKKLENKKYLLLKCNCSKHLFDSKNKYLKHMEEIHNSKVPRFSSHIFDAHRKMIENPEFNQKMVLEELLLPDTYFCGLCPTQLFLTQDQLGAHILLKHQDECQHKASSHFLRKNWKNLLSGTELKEVQKLIHHHK